MTVPYEVAVSTILSMFNNQIERDVVCSVLEANHGHMEKTVEVLLAMNNELPPEETISQNTEFAQKQAQIKEDERLAKVLQNRMFVDQITQIPEFSDLFSFPSFRRSSSNTSNVATANEPDITDKIKQLGDVAKLKLKELAFKFKNTTLNKSGSNLTSEYQPVRNGEEDTAEVIEFDTNITKRVTSEFKEDVTVESDDDEIPLEFTRKKNQVSSSESQSKIVQKTQNPLSPRSQTSKEKEE